MSAFRRRWLPIAAVCLTLPLSGLAGCSKSSDTATRDTSSQSQTSEQPKTPTTGTAGKLPTLADYIKQNEISEAPVKLDDNSAPEFKIPAVLGWEDAGENTPPDAYGALVNVDPVFEADPPSIVIVYSKLGANADPAEILKLAPNELKNLAQFDDNKTAPQPFQLSGFDAVRYAGTYLRDGETRLIGQETVAVPTKDGVYVLQFNGDAETSQVQALTLAFNAINEQGVISLTPIPNPETPSPAETTTKPGG